MQSDDPAAHEPPAYAVEACATECRGQIRGPREPPHARREVGVRAPTGQNLSVYVSRPDGSGWQNTTPSGGPNGGTVSLQNMSQTGTYTVVLSPYYGVTATMNVTVQ